MLRRGEGAVLPGEPLPREMSSPEAPVETAMGAGDWLVIHLPGATNLSPSDTPILRMSRVRLQEAKWSAGDCTASKRQGGDLKACFLRGQERADAGGGKAKILVGGARNRL